MFKAFVLLLTIRASVASRPSSPLPFKNVIYAEYSEHPQRLDIAYRQCSSRPQVPPTSGFLAGESFLFATKGVEGVLESDQQRNRRDHGLSGGGRDLLLLPGQKGSLLSLGDTIPVDEVTWLPDEEFTVDLWVKPESGQENPAVILAADDSCSPFQGEGWEVGISAKQDGERFPYFYARIQTASSSQETRLESTPTIYHSDRWVHLGLTYDGEETKLFVNGARVGRSFKQKGKIFQRLHVLDSASSCRNLLLGGGFRGLIAIIRLWKKALTPIEVVSAMKAPLTFKNYPDIPQISSLVMWENFEGRVSWDWSDLNSNPQRVPSSFQFPLVDMTPVIPTPCGFTICDSPEIVKSYETNWELRTPKTIRYNVINVRNSDGTNETVTKRQINAQHRALNRAFGPYNITWEYKEIAIRDTSLRRKTILIGCKPQFMGNGNCDPKCNQLSTTNNDGGDCDLSRRSCRSSKQGNGKCDQACNVAYHKWDKGDCCDPAITDVTVTCLDPTSPNRAFLSLEEYKKIISAPSDQGVNIFFAHWTNKDIVGLATFPWEKEARTSLGGVLVRPEDFGIEGQMDTLVHELGHVLGLWHVHRGVSELECDHPCFESEPSLTAGDLCFDTKPTVAHSACRDPDSHRLACGIGPFTETPYNNYMSYSDDSCSDSFTPQQAARMHCYVDLAYPSWLAKSTEISYPPPPLPPRVTSISTNAVSIVWVPPINQALYLQDDAPCTRCTPEKGFFQYADVAVGHRGAYGEYATPREATGAPDSETCSPSVHSWMPDPVYCTATNTTQEACSLSLTFKVPVVPYSVSIWMNYNSRLGLSEVQLVFTDGSTLSLGPARSSCDERFTFIISQVLPWLSVEKERKEVKGLILYTASPFVSVDAVQLISDPNHPSCSRCKAVRYLVYRDPPFPDGVDFVETEDTELIDSSFKEVAVDYQYRVRAYSGNKVSLPSPVLIHRNGANICGDAVLDKEREECDDGNLINDDGCDKTCQIEAGFFCNGWPSTCYWHEGDEVCEVSERELVFEDCGRYTPNGFTDQWAERVETFPEFDNPDCPISSVAGPPLTNLKECNDGHNASKAWRPCIASNIKKRNPLKFDAFFKNPGVAASVQIHLESDGKLFPETLEFEGRRIGNSRSKHRDDNEADATVELIGFDGETTPLGPVSLYCSKNPITIPIHQDLTRPFKLSKGIRVRFSSPDASFAAVALRTLSWNPVTVSQCQADSSHSIYSPLLDNCLRQRTCNRPTCQEPLVKNGRLECSGFQEGDVCSLVCDSGYFLLESAEKQWTSKTARVTCANGNWLGDSLTCRPVDCHLPKIPQADALCPDGTTYGKSCTFKCRPPARLRTIRNGASGSSPVVTCTKSGIWTEPEPICHLSCPVPSIPDYAVLVDEACQKRKNFAYGQKCKFRCREGYNVVVEGVKRRHFESRCDGSGLWNVDVCVPVTCPPPDTREGGSLKCSDDFRFGSVCSLDCQVSKQEIKMERFNSVCESDGKWNPPFPTCPPTAEHCLSPNLHPSISMNCDNLLQDSSIFQIGQKCSVSCLHLEQEIFGFEAGEEKNIKCTGRGTWYPNPESILCALECRMDSLNDSYCDGINNRELCGWDGGDCCESTLKVKGQKVKPMPVSCGDACRCKQPGAT